MGLFNILKNAGAAAYDGLQKNAAEIQEIKDRMEYCSDDQLFRELCNGSYQRKAASSLLLQERGYTKDQISDAINGRR